ncbi:MAG: hypothetical protein AAB428_03130 [Patescibacteria group bacterium]
MARILSSEDVESGFIPTGYSFNQVVREIKNRLDGQPGIFSVIQIGSIQREDSNCISDADIVVAYSRYMRKSIFCLLSALCGYARGLAVPLEFIPLDHTFAARGAHFWTPSFTMHVKWAEEHDGIICGKAVTPNIIPRDERKSEGLDYAISKLQKILKKVTLLPVMDERERYDLFTEVVQVPVFLARKIVWDMGVRLPLDSKAEVIEAYIKNVSQEESLHFRNLIQVAARYRNLVESRPRAEFYKFRVTEDIGTAGLERLIRYLEITIENILARRG